MVYSLCERYKNKMMDFGFDAFDIFDTSVVEEKKDGISKAENTSAQELPVVKKAVNKTTSGIPFIENSDIEGEEDETDSLSTSEENVEKKGKKQPKNTTKKDCKLKGIINVIGNGWNTTFGEKGVEYDVATVAKTLYDNGFKEIALAKVMYTSSSLYVNVVDRPATSEDVQMGDSITIELGNFKVTYQVDDFGGLTAQEISLFDVLLKFQQDNPQFAGCGLVFHGGAKVASPVFTKKVTVEPDQMYPVWSEAGVQSMNGADIKDDNVYVSDTGTYFVVSSVPKSASQLFSSSLDIAKDNETKKAIDIYRLPFSLWVETFGTTKACTKEDFNGKEAVTKEDIIKYLGGAYRIFRSPSRKFSISYDRNSAVVGVAVVSGEKGAAFSAVQSSSKIVNFIDYPRKFSTIKERVEKTALGLFKGIENDTQMLSLDIFEMALPKIPGYLLDTIIADFRRDLSKESMIQVYYSMHSNSYYLVRPEFSCDKVSVRYQMTHTDDILVMSIHSHNTMPAVFSRVDDEDEIYTGLFGVIGDLDKPIISTSFRAGMEGKFKALKYADIFSSGGDAA